MYMQRRRKWKIPKRNAKFLLGLFAVGVLVVNSFLSVGGNGRGVKHFTRDYSSRPNEMEMWRRGWPRCESVRRRIMFTSPSTATQACARDNACAYVSWSALTLRAQLCALPSTGMSTLPCLMGCWWRPKGGCFGVPATIAKGLPKHCGSIAKRWTRYLPRASCKDGKELDYVRAETLHEAAVACISYFDMECTGFAWENSVVRLCSEMQRSGQSAGYEITDVPWRKVLANRPQWSVRPTSSGLDIHSGVVPNCGEFELHKAFPLRSFEETASLCASHPKCVVMAFDQSNGLALMCRGLYSLDPASDWISGVKLGCESYSSTQAIHEMEKGEAPSCAWTVPAKECQPGTYFVSFREDGEVVCDECPPEGCAEWVDKVSTNSLSASAFDRRLQVQALRLSRFAHPRAFNPSIFEHEDQRYIAVRISNGTQCLHKSTLSGWDLDRPHERPICGGILICKLSGAAFMPLEGTCKRVRANGVVLGTPSLGDPQSFIGEEDPRGFSFMGSIWIVAFVNVHVGRVMVSRPLLLKLDENFDVKKTYPVKAGWNFPQLLPQKNWMPLPNGKELYFVHSFNPLQLCYFDFETGFCEARANSSQGSLPNFSGGTPFLPSTEGWLGIVHRHRPMALGKQYAHRFLWISKRDRQFIIERSSPSFRLPQMTNGSSSSPDVQFVAGFVPYGEGFVVSYGIADCYSSLALLNVGGENQFKTALNRSTSTRDHQPTNHASYILFEGPFSAARLKGAEARAQGMNIITAANNLNMTVALYDTTPVIEEKVRPNGFPWHLVVRSNYQLCCPKVTIRYWWPLRLTPIVHGKLVLLWEMEAKATTNTNPLTMSHIDEFWMSSNVSVEKGPRVIQEKVHMMPYLGAMSHCSAGEASFNERQAQVLAFTVGDNVWGHGLDIALRGFLEASERSITEQGLSKAVLIVVVGSFQAQGEMQEKIQKFTGKKASHSAIRVMAHNEETIGALAKESDIFISVPRLEGATKTMVERAKACSVPTVSLETHGGRWHSHIRAPWRRCTPSYCDSMAESYFGKFLSKGKSWREPFQEDVTNAIIELVNPYLRANFTAKAGSEAHDSEAYAIQGLEHSLRRVVE